MPTLTLSAANLALVRRCFNSATPQAVGCRMTICPFRARQWQRPPRPWPRRGRASLTSVDWCGYCAAGGLMGALIFP